MRDIILNMKNILVVGLGYVGLSYALNLARFHHVHCVDIDVNKINKLKEGISPINTEEFVNSVNKDSVKDIHFIHALMI